MLPIRDTVPSRHYPFITITLIGLNVAFWLGLLAFGETERRALMMMLGVVPRRYTDSEWATEAGLDPDNYLPFVTSMFLHGGWLHIILNMWILWIFGDNVEDRMGWTRFILFYLICGVVSAIAQVLAHPNAALPMVGASGAIAGVMGAYLFLYPRAKVLTVIPVFFYPLFIEIPAVAFMLIWFIGQVVSGIMATVGDVQGGIAWWAHIGGFVAGALLHRLFLKHKAAPRDLWNP